MQSIARVCLSLFFTCKHTHTHFGKALSGCFPVVALDTGPSNDGNVCVYCGVPAEVGFFGNLGGVVQSVCIYEWIPSAVCRNGFLLTIDTLLMCVYCWTY